MKKAQSNIDLRGRTSSPVHLHINNTSPLHLHIKSSNRSNSDHHDSVPNGLNRNSSKSNFTLQKPPSANSTSNTNKQIPVENNDRSGEHHTNDKMWEARDKENRQRQMQDDLVRKEKLLADATKDVLKERASHESLKTQFDNKLKQSEKEVKKLMNRIQDLETELNKSKIDKDYLNELVNETKNKADQDIETLIKATKNQKQRADKNENLFEQLSNELHQKDNLLHDQKLDLSKALTRADKLAKENNTLRGYLLQLEAAIQKEHDEHERELKGCDDSYSSGDHDGKEILLTKSRFQPANHKNPNESNESNRTYTKQDQSLSQEIAQLKDLLKDFEIKLDQCQQDLQDKTRRLDETTRKSKASEENTKSLQTKNELLEKRLEQTRNDVDHFTRLLNQRDEEMQKTIKEKENEKILIMEELEKSLDENRKMKLNPLYQEQALKQRVHDLETQCKKLTTQCDQQMQFKTECEIRYAEKIELLKQKLAHSNANNKALAEYVQLLKTSYTNVFGTDDAVLRSLKKHEPKFSTVKTK